MNTSTLDALDARRQELQRSVDAASSREERNRQGQYATPQPTADAIAREVARLCPVHMCTLLEPAMGLGAFVTAFFRAFDSRAGHVVGVEADDKLAHAASLLWSGADVDVQSADFFSAFEVLGQKRFDVLLSNPPYMRHHHLASERKGQLAEAVALRCHVRLSALSGLHCYMLLLSATLVAPGGVAAWLVPGEFLDVGYGKAVKEFLATHLTLLRIHRFPTRGSLFDGALVTSVVVFCRATPPAEATVCHFTEGSDIEAPLSNMAVPLSQLRPERKWSAFFAGTAATDNGPTIGHYFRVKRGMVTGDNSFFLLTDDAVARYSIPVEFVRPLLPPPRRLTVGDRLDVTQSEPLFVCAASEELLRERWPGVWSYIETHAAEQLRMGYVCAQRRQWWSCPYTPGGHIVVPYMGRLSASGASPFTFLGNPRRLNSTNVYLHLVPRPPYTARLSEAAVRLRVITALRRLPTERLIVAGRCYGGGLLKLEPGELMATPAGELADILGQPTVAQQPTLF